MMKYPAKFPSLISSFFPELITQIPNKEKKVFLSFDDGPHPKITPWILNELDKYNAKASFFCVGEKIISHPNLIELIINKGHSIGNHTYSHKDAWKTSHKEYLKEINLTQNILLNNGVKSKLFRPPYGRISPFQIKKINKFYKIIMWTYLSGDFKKNINVQSVNKKLIEKIQAGDIIVFHDTEKAFRNLKKILPLLLEQLKERNFIFEKIV